MNHIISPFGNDASKYPIFSVGESLSRKCGTIKVLIIVYYLNYNIGPPYQGNAQKTARENIKKRKGIRDFILETN